MKKVWCLGFTALLIIAGLTHVFGAELTTDQALQKLKEGNKRYINSNRQYLNLDHSRRTLTSTKGQNPFATVIGCSDSRVPVEHLFDVGVGDVFVIRVAGNVCNVDEIGSIEYGVEHLRTPLLVVLGHSSCGAVTAVARGDEVHGSIPALVQNIYPAVDKAKEIHGEHFSQELLEASIELNVWQSIEDLLKSSHGTADLVRNGELKIVGAVYDLASGEVHWLGEHPQLASLLAYESAATTHSTSEKTAAKKKNYTSGNENTTVYEASVGGPSKQGAGKVKMIVIILLVFIGLVYFLLLNKRTALRMRLKSRILSIALVLLVLMAGLGTVSNLYLSSIGEELYGIAEENIPLSKLIAHIDAHQLEQSIIVSEILKHTYDNSVSRSEKVRLVEEHKKEFIEFSQLTDKELREAEELCNNAIKHEKHEEDIKEFRDALDALKKIEKEQHEFEEDAEKLFESLAHLNYSMISEYEQTIEEEEAQIHHEIDSMAHVIDSITANAASTAESHEAEAKGVSYVLIIISLVIGFVLSFIISNLIARPILNTVKFAGKIADGDLTQTLQYDQDDEIGEMTQALLRMVEKLKYIISEILSGSENIVSASQQISSSSQQLSQAANEQASSVEEVSSTMEEIAANIEQNTENAGQTEKIAGVAREGIQDVGNRSAETVSANKLISEKISIITDIAFQTNILALNAAVEAARAGEHGKGFAVVAAEVRKLAERSKAAAGEIVGLATNSLELAELAGKKMEDILPEVEKTTQLVQEIAAASLEQNNGAEQVNNAVQQLNSVTQQNAAASEELATSAEEMASQADQLRDAVSFFRVESNGNGKMKAYKVTGGSGKEVGGMTANRIADTKSSQSSKLRSYSGNNGGDERSAKGVEIRVDSKSDKDSDYESF